MRSRAHSAFQYPRSRVVGCNIGMEVKISSAVKPFQYPRSRVVGCNPHPLPDAVGEHRSFSTLGVGSLAVTTLMPARWSAQAAFQYPRSRVVGCNGIVPAEKTVGFVTFSTLGVGSLAVTSLAKEH